MSRIPFVALAVLSALIAFARWDDIQHRALIVACALVESFVLVTLTLVVIKLVRWAWTV